LTLPEWFFAIIRFISIFEAAGFALRTRFTGRDGAHVLKRVVYCRWPRS
jgi:hypothetical protein